MLPQPPGAEETIAGNVVVMNSAAGVVETLMTGLTATGFVVDTTRRSSGFGASAILQVMLESDARGDDVMELTVRVMVPQGHNLGAALDTTIEVLDGLDGFSPVAWSASYAATGVLFRSDTVVDFADILVVSSHRTL